MPKIEIDLKTCPFCGGKAHIYEFTKEEAKNLVMKMHYGENEKKEAIEYVLKIPTDIWAIIGCETKDCILYANEKAHMSSLFFRETSAERLAEKWNKRPPLIVSVPKNVSVKIGDAVKNGRGSGIEIAPVIGTLK